MKKNLLVVLSVFLSLTTTFAMAKETIIWMGCGISKEAFMNKLADVYTQRTGIPFRMSGGGATKGIRLTATGKSELGGSCRQRLMSESDKIVPEEKNVEMRHVAWDALVSIVHEKNKVNNLTSQQVKNIFTGKITNWSQVGGYNQKIQLLVRRGKISGVGYMFRLMVMKDKDFAFPATAKKFLSSGPLEKNIESRFVNGIGITGVSSAKKRKVKILSIDGVYPSKENIASGKYPLFRPLYLVVSRNMTSKLKKFVDFVFSETGQKLISEEGTVNLKEGIALKKLWKYGAIEK